MISLSTFIGVRIDLAWVVIFRVQIFSYYVCYILVLVYLIYDSNERCLNNKLVLVVREVEFNVMFIGIRVHDA